MLHTRLVAFPPVPVAPFSARRASFYSTDRLHHASVAYGAAVPDLARQPTGVWLKLRWLPQVALPKPRSSRAGVAKHLR